MPGPWEKYAQPQDNSPPAFIPGQVNPVKQAAEARAQQDQSIQLEKLEMEKEKFSREKSGESANESERKAAAFLIRALGSNESYEKQGIGPRSYVGQAIAETAPDFLNILPSGIGNSSERQVADTNQDEFIAASLRQDSGAAIPDPEMERQRRIYFPMPGDGPATREAKRQARLRAIEGLRQSAGRLESEAEQRYLQMTSGGPPVKENTPVPVGFDPGDTRVQANTSGFRNEDDPALVSAGVMDAYRGLLEAKEQPGRVVSRLRELGVTDPTVLRDAARQAAFRRSNPNVPLSKYNFEKVDDRVVPLSAFEEAATSLGDNPVGSYLMGAGQFLSGNTLDNMASDPERARAALEIARTQNPNAYVVGEVSGGILGALTGEAGLARLGASSGIMRGLTADAAMGGANAAGAADDPGQNRLANAAKGAGAAIAGNLAGNALTRGAARMIGPTGGSMGELYGAGVRPTIGQRVADKGVMGRMVNTLEQKAQSIPIVGDAIQGARQGARDEFQIGAFNEALKEVGEQLPKGIKPGTDPHAYAQKTFDRIYAEARSGMRMVPDKEFGDDLAAFAGDIKTLGPKAQGRFKAIMQNSVNNRFSNGAIEGADYKKAITSLGDHISRHAKSLSPEDQQLAEVLKGVRSALENGARRHSDPAAVELLDAADSGYAKFIRIEEAAQRRGGDAGTFTPAGFDASVQKAGGGVRSKAYLRGDALMQDFAKAGRNLDDTVPNSGTVDRALAVGGTAAAGFLEPTTLGLLGAIGAAYAPGARKVVQNAMAPAGPKRKAIAGQLQKRARLAASATASAAAAQGTAQNP